MGNPSYPGRDIPPGLLDKVLVDGRLVDTIQGKRLNVYDPATGDVLGTAAKATAGDIDTLAASAAAAQPDWAAMSAGQRSRILYQCADILEQNGEHLARLISLETGKALAAESRPEIAGAVDMVRYFAGLCGELKGLTLPREPGSVAMTTREPHGVVGAILSWNVPLLLLAVKAAPALASGNTVVVKTSEYAPFTVLEAARLMGERLPPGVLNVAGGDGEAGAALVRNQRINMITFTGSEQAGRAVNRAAADRLIPVTLELGGKCPMLILPDTPVQDAVEGAFHAMRFTRQGQSCTATSRILVHEDLQEAFVAGLRSRLDAMVIGDPLEEQTQAGPLISASARDRLQQALEGLGGISGMKVYRSGTLPTENHLSPGYYFKPALITGLPSHHPLVQEELFGPVVSIGTWREESELIGLANETRFGLAAVVWTRDLERAMSLTRLLEAGSVHVNQNPPIRAGLSFGGFRSSGLGREASLESMLESFTKTKTLTMRFSRVHA